MTQRRDRQSGYRLPGLHSSTLLRRPVSATRARIGWTLLATLTAAFIAFHWSTSDQRIRRRAEAFLRSATGGRVSVESARFSLFDGITLERVRVATPRTARVSGSADSEAAHELFSAESLRLIHDPWRLLLMQLDVREIVATGPTFQIVQDSSTGRFNWQDLALPARRRTLTGPPKPPRVRLRNTKVVLATLENGKLRQPTPIELDVDATPDFSAADAYFLDIRSYRPRAEKFRMRYDARAGSLSKTPAVALSAVRALLPETLRTLFDKLELRGEMQSRGLQYAADAGADRAVRLEFKDVDLVVPLSLLGSSHVERRWSDPPRETTDDPPIFRMRLKSGQLNLEGSILELRGFDGTLDDAPCRVAGVISEIDHSLDQVGLDLRVGVSRLKMPEGEIRRRMLAADAPLVTREFLHLLDPIGRLSFEGRIHRPAGPDGETRVDGVLDAHGVSARHLTFPYRLEDVVGRTRLTNGAVTIEGLTGRHGSSIVQIAGEVDSTHPWTGFNLEIAGRGVPLDAALFRVLGPSYRTLWQRFDARGFANVRVRTERPDGDPANGSRPGTTRLDIELLDAAVRFDEFPYPLRSLRARLRVGPGVLRIDDLVGMGVASGAAGEPEPATVRADGYYLDPETSSSPGHLELRLEARRLRLDSQLLAALPVDARVAFEQLEPTGYVDLLGRVFTSPTDPALHYDIETRLSGAGMRYRELPYAISDITGRIHITPDRLTLIEISGRHKRTLVLADGKVEEMPEGYAAELSLRLRDLELDADARAAVPPTLRTTWDALGPSGMIDLDSRIERTSKSGQVETKYDAAVLLRGAAVRPQVFPLPLSDLRGTLEVSERRVELHDVAGRCGEAEIRNVGGRIELTDDGAAGKLQFEANDMRFDESLAAAVPAELRTFWRALAPKGRFDLRLSDLSFDIAADRPAAFSWTGSLTLHDVAMALGLQLTKLNGTIRGRGAIGGADGGRFSGEAELQQAHLGPFELHDLRFKAIATADGQQLHLKECDAELFAGRAAGECRIDLGTGSGGFEMTFNVRDAQLGPCLRALGWRSAEADAARGLLFGKFAFRGQSGRPEQFRGSGEVFVREAHVWKLPLVLTILRVLNLTPDENMFHDGWLKFHIQGRRMYLTKIDLQGKAIALVGSGTLRTDNQELDLQLLAGSPTRLRVPLVTELVEGASRDLFELHVTGTLQEPRIETRQASNMRKALEKLFPPRGDDDRR